MDEKFRNLLQHRSSLKHFFPILTVGDENCFYYSISFLIYGNIENFWKVRIGLLFILIEYEEYLRRLLKGTVVDIEYESLVEKSVQNLSWANEY